MYQAATNSCCLAFLTLWIVAPHAVIQNQALLLKGLRKRKKKKGKKSYTLLLTGHFYNADLNFTVHLVALFFYKDILIDLYFLHFLDPEFLW